MSKLYLYLYRQRRQNKTRQNETIIENKIPALFFSLRGFVFYKSINF